MTRDIKVGDLVLLLHPRNPIAQKFAGEVRTVHAPSRIHTGQWRLDPPTRAEDGNEIVWPPHLLKLIPPISELESEKKQEEIKA